MDPSRPYAGISLSIDEEDAGLVNEFYLDVHNLTSKTRGWVRDMVGVGVPFVQWPDVNTVVALLKASPQHTYVSVRCYSLFIGQFDHDDAWWPDEVPHQLGASCVCWQHGKIRARKHCVSIGCARRACF